MMEDSRLPPQEVNARVEHWYDSYNVEARLYMLSSNARVVKNTRAALLLLDRNFGKWKAAGPDRVEWSADDSSAKRFEQAMLNVQTYQRMQQEGLEALNSEPEPAPPEDSHTDRKPQDKDDDAPLRYVPWG